MKARWRAGALGLWGVALAACVGGGPVPATRASGPVAKPSTLAKASPPAAKASPPAAQASAAAEAPLPEAEAMPEATGPLRLSLRSMQPQALQVRVTPGQVVDGLRQAPKVGVTPDPPDWKLVLAVPKGGRTLRLMGATLSYAFRTAKSGETWNLAGEDSILFPPVTLEPGLGGQAGVAKELVIPLALQPLTRRLDGEEVAVAFEYRLALKAQGQDDPVLGPDGAALSLVLPAAWSP